LGYASFRKLDWESKYFGMKMATLKIKSLSRSYNQNKKVASLLIKDIINMAKKKKIEHLSVKINPFQIEEIHALEENGFYFVASLVSFILNLNSADFCGANPPRLGIRLGTKSRTFINIERFRKKDLVKLKTIALNSFKDRGIWLDRFHADPHLDKKKSDELYVKWLVNCCRGKEADLILVARRKGIPVGFITSKFDKDIDKYLKKKMVRIPLNAVDKKVRGQGIYRSLVGELLSVLKDKGIEYALITTQLTTRAVARVWMGLGAKVDSLRLVFHKFIPQKGNSLFRAALKERNKLLEEE
jgi:GNAT superfamily N-acetyltransferase